MNTSWRLKLDESLIASHFFGQQTHSGTVQHAEFSNDVHMIFKRCRLKRGIQYRDVLPYDVRSRILAGRKGTLSEAPTVAESTASLVPYSASHSDVSLTLVVSQSTYIGTPNRFATIDKSMVPDREDKKSRSSCMYACLSYLQSCPHSIWHLRPQRMHSERTQSPWRHQAEE